MEGRGADPLSWSLLSNSDACVAPSESPTCAAANLPIEETEVAQRCEGVEKSRKKKKKRAGKTGASETHPMVGAILCPEDHDTQTKTSPSAESARAGNSSTHQRKQPSDAMPRHAPRGALIFIQSATAVVKREAGVLSQIRFGRVKSNARDSKPERRPNPELVVIIATFLLQMNVGEDPTGRCKEQEEERRWGKLASIVPESHVNPSKPRVETRFRGITHHGRWCPILLLLAVYYHGV